MNTNQTSTQQRRLFTRQPIFDAAENLWGHELLNPGGPWPAEDAPRKEARPEVAFYAFPPGARVGAKKTVVSFSHLAVIEDLPRALPRSQTIVEIRESDGLGTDLVAALDSLKAARYQVALDDYQGRPGCDILLERADMVSINILGKTKRQLREMVAQAGRFGAKLCAKGVENRKLLEIAKEIGFSRFQGGFFKKPDILITRKLSPNEAARFRLFEIIESGSPDFAKLAETISMDVSISYRLLLFLNSAAFSFPVEITSINHAVVILGWEQVKTWLRMAILSELAPAHKSSELMRLSAQRANFFKLAAKRGGYTEEPPDDLFLLGLFSLMEPMLDMPMKEIVETLPLREQLKAGLCRQLKVHTLWLELAQRIESGDWFTVERIVRYLGLDPQVVASAYYDALVLTSTFFNASSERNGEMSH